MQEITLSVIVKFQFGLKNCELVATPCVTKNLSIPVNEVFFAVSKEPRLSLRIATFMNAIWNRCFHSYLNNTCYFLAHN